MKCVECGTEGGHGGMYNDNGAFFCSVWCYVEGDGDLAEPIPSKEAAA